MKRIIPILLILAMLLSFAVTAHAEEAQTGTVTLAAPTLCSVQTAVNQGDATLHDVRFLSTVSDLRGTALGMEIRATFVSDGKTQSVLYNADDGLEGNTVYSSVKATVDGEEKSVTAAELAGGGCGCGHHDPAEGIPVSFAGRKRNRAAGRGRSAGPGG